MQKLYCKFGNIVCTRSNWVIQISEGNTKWSNNTKEIKTVWYILQ